MIFAGFTHPDFARAEEGSDVIFRLQQYKPMYFAMGWPDTKIDVSFKVKLIDRQNIFFGYSQIMMWELFKDSPYFRDINYNPEFFYRCFIDESEAQWIDFSPYEHESNGRGQVNERSWNRAYVRYHAQAHISQEQKIFYSVKAWIGYGYNPNNADIAQYRGLWETELTFANILGASFERSDLSLRIYAGAASGLDPLRGGQELIWQIKSKMSYFPLLIFELFHGYGENLINYKDDRFGARAGVGF